MSLRKPFDRARAEPLSADEQRALDQRHRRQVHRRMAFALVVSAIWLALGLIRVGSYVIIKPGSADPVDRRLRINGVKTYAPTGDTFWATVGVIERPAPLQLIAAWLSGSQDAPKRRDVYGNESPKASRRTSSIQMEDAKQIAVVVAARKLGYPVSGGGAEVAEVGPKYPAFKLLKTGDVISAVNGTPVCIQADIGRGLGGVKPGDTVTITVRRDGKTTDIRTPTVRVPDYDRPVIGVLLTAETKRPCRASFTAAINTDQIGGPSAGLAMTVALLERLSPGELTGGKKVAITGTIEGDETVGEVGGVKQKTLAVKAAGAKLFIVPMSEVALARPHAGSMRVVGVSTLDDALAALREIGGDPLVPVAR